MTDNTEQPGKEGQPEFSDQAIRRFLFGSLSAAEQTAFEERLFTDDAFETQVRRAECELADDYTFERLSADERKLFEEKFLVSNDREQKLSVSQALRERFASDVTQTVSLRPPPDNLPVSRNRLGIRERLQDLFSLNQPAWRLVLGVVILLVLVGTIWSVLRAPGKRIPFTTKRRVAPPASPVTNQQQSHHPTKAPPPLQEETPLPPDSGNPEVVQLLPGSIYDPERIPRLSLPDGERTALRVQLAFKPDQLGMYRAELLTVAGQSVFLEAQLKLTNENGPIDFDIPVRVLKAGDYQIKLSRVKEGNEESVATYYFRLQ